MTVQWNLGFIQPKDDPDPKRARFYLWAHEAEGDKPAEHVLLVIRPAFDAARSAQYGHRPGVQSKHASKILAQSNLPALIAYAAEPGRVYGVRFHTPLQGPGADPEGEVDRLSVADVAAEFGGDDNLCGAAMDLIYHTILTEHHKRWPVLWQSWYDWIRDNRPRSLEVATPVLQAQAQKVKAPVRGSRGLILHPAEFNLNGWTAWVARTTKGETAARLRLTDGVPVEATVINAAGEDTPYPLHLGVNAAEAIEGIETALRALGYAVGVREGSP